MLDELTKSLGLVKVGWIFTDLISSANGKVGSIISTWFRGIYSGQPEKSPPPPSKIPSGFCGHLSFIKVFNVCFITLFFFLLSPPFPFFLVFLQIIPCFSLWTKFPPRPGEGGGKWPEYISLRDLEVTFPCSFRVTCFY